jgi:hypothetical protein
MPPSTDGAHAGTPLARASSRRMAPRGARSVARGGRSTAPRFMGAQRVLRSRGGAPALRADVRGGGFMAAVAAAGDPAWGVER